MMQLPTVMFFARTLISSASSLPDDGYAIQIWPAPKVTLNWNNCYTQLTIL